MYVCSVNMFVCLGIRQKIEKCLASCLLLIKMSFSFERVQTVAIVSQVPEELHIQVELKSKLVDVQCSERF